VQYVCHNDGSSVNRYTNTVATTAEHRRRLQTVYMLPGRRLWKNGDNSLTITLITMVCEHVVHKTVRSCVIRFHRQIGRFKHFFGAKATYNEKRMQHKNLLVCNLRHALNTHSHAFVVLRYFLDSMMCSVPRTRNMIHGSRNECIEKEWSGKVLVT